MGGDDLLAEFIQNDWRNAELTEAERAMLEWSEKLTLSPAMMTEADIQHLRDVGWTDRDTLDIAHICAYFNYRVRMVDGLGLQVLDERAASSTKSRQHAVDLAKAKGVVLPNDIWGVGEQAKEAQGRTATARRK